MESWDMRPAQHSWRCPCIFVVMEAKSGVRLRALEGHIGSLRVRDWKEGVARWIARGQCVLSAKGSVVNLPSKRINDFLHSNKWKQKFSDSGLCQLSDLRELLLWKQRLPWLPFSPCWFLVWWSGAGAPLVAQRSKSCHPSLTLPQQPSFRRIG